MDLRTAVKKLTENKDFKKAISLCDSKKDMLEVNSIKAIIYNCWANIYVNNFRIKIDDPDKCLKFFQKSFAEMMIKFKEAQKESSDVFFKASELKALCQIVTILYEENKCLKMADNILSGLPMKEILIVNELNIKGGDCAIIQNTLEECRSLYKKYSNQSNLSTDQTDNIETATTNLINILKEHNISAKICTIDDLKENSNDTNINDYEFMG